MAFDFICVSIFFTKVAKKYLTANVFIVQDFLMFLSYQNEHFSEYRTKRVQEFRIELSQGIRSQIFFATFVKNIETHIKSNAMTKALKQLIHQQVYHL